MKKLVFRLAILVLSMAAILVACEKQDPLITSENTVPSDFDGDNLSSESLTIKPENSNEKQLETTNRSRNNEIIGMGTNSSCLGEPQVSGCLVSYLIVTDSNDSGTFWRMGDGKLIWSNPGFVHRYRRAGTYNITGSNGCSFVVVVEDDPNCGRYNEDKDQDGIIDDLDNCIDIYNPMQVDSDNDGKGDECDLCFGDPYFAEIDSDGDGIPNTLDNCAWSFNPNQSDINNNGIGDACENSQYIPPNTFSNFVNLQRIKEGALCCPAESPHVYRFKIIHFVANQLRANDFSMQGAGVIRERFWRDDQNFWYVEFFGSGNMNIRVNLPGFGQRTSGTFISPGC